MNRSGRFGWLAGVLVILTGLYGAALILFTLAPPELPIFIGGFVIFAQICVDIRLLCVYNAGEKTKKER